MSALHGGADLTSHDWSLQTCHGQRLNTDIVHIRWTNQCLRFRFRAVTYTIYSNIDREMLVWSSGKHQFCWRNGSVRSHLPRVLFVLDTNSFPGARLLFTLVCLPSGGCGFECKFIARNDQIEYSNHCASPRRMLVSIFVLALVYLKIKWKTRYVT